MVSSDCSLAHEFLERIRPYLLARSLPASSGGTTGCFQSSRGLDMCTCIRNFLASR